MSLFLEIILSIGDTDFLSSPNTAIYLAIPFLTSDVENALLRSLLSSAFFLPDKTSIIYGL